MDSQEALAKAKQLADSIESIATELTPVVIRAARLDANGRKSLDQMEYALGTIGKALVLTDYTIDQEKDMDKLKSFRDSQNTQD
ncbi:MAG: hypothetical protein CL862_10935 [Cyanobium sp. NAT70]|nr:hypothetical protein [Cyanobium sp. NAT70]|tara:strand:+ start:381 stop:632 length:252 start_codon:yes stop_codon:yes gene_type:complete